MRPVRALVACAVLAFSLLLVAVATAEIPPASTPATGALKLEMLKVGGRPLFASTGQRIVVQGIVTPYVAGQEVQLGFYLDGRKTALKTVPVLGGRFRIDYSSREAGSLQVRAEHAATTAQVAFTARSKVVQIVHTNLGPGAAGASVRLLQRELAALHYAVPVNGRFDEATGLALVAYRKMTNLERIAYSGKRVFELLAKGAGAFHVRYRGDGRHVEANLTKQVLAEIEPGGKVHLIYTTSSGKPSTPTVIGRFRVYLKTPGTNSEGMVDSNYFIRGYAIHGYAEVPTYAASHGCLRVPIMDAPAIYGWVREGTPVDVYNEDGGGSARVRSDAGP
jgi:peptidoglycan hydrolase-like protein with peptidoglycan-binding domain